MFELTDFSLKDMTECASALRRMGAGSTSMEETAQKVVQFLYDNLRFRESEERSCALVRFFKTHPYADLEPELQAFAKKTLGDEPSAETKCLTLLATAGETEKWNSRHFSAGHQAIPLPGPEMVQRSPMIAQLIRQLGLDIGSVVSPDPSVVIDLSQKAYNVFFIPEALGSPHIPAQADFIQKFGICSVIGFGGLLPSGNLFATIVFSKTAIDHEVADLFRPLALSLKMALLPFDGGRIFISDKNQQPNQSEELRRIQLTTFDQLLEVHEKAVMNQSERLKRALADLGQHTRRLRTSEQALEIRVQELAEANTELQSLTEKLEAARDQAIAGSRVKSEFVANISHEIRTPISGIIGMTELLLDGGLKGEDRSLALTVHEFAQSLLTIINDILDFSKMEAGKVDLEIMDFSTADLIEGTTELLAATARAKNLSLTVYVAPELPPVLQGDSVRLRQILMNLLSNAIKFTDKGEVAVHAESLGEDENTVKVRFSIRDTGIGIKKNVVNALFQPFAQADGSTTRKYGGTGLGLSICKGLVELMGGQIGFESIHGEGSTFWFTVPLAKSKEKPQHISQSNQSISGQHSRLEAPHPVLLAEDNPLLQDLALRQLRKLGLHAQAVSNGRAAVEAIKTGSYSVILMDCQMPDMDGFEATSAIRKLEKDTGKHVPIIAMTASAMKQDRDNCMSSGMDDYLSKPVSLEQLRGVLAQWLGHQVETEPLALRLPLPGSNDPIDVSALVQLYGQESVSEILQAFLQEGQELIADLRQCVADNDARRAASISHQLKGLSSVLSANDMNTLSRHAETLSKQSEFAQLSDTCKALQREYDRMSDFIHRLIPSS